MKERNEEVEKEVTNGKKTEERERAMEECRLCMYVVHVRVFPFR